MSTVPFLAPRSPQHELSPVLHALEYRKFTMSTVPFLPSRSLQPELSLVLHDWHPMSTVPFLASRSLHPELSLSCMTETPFHCSLPGLQVTSAAWTVPVLHGWHPMYTVSITNKHYMKQCFSHSYTQPSKLNQWNNHQQWFTIYSIRSMCTSTQTNDQVHTNASQNASMRVEHHNWAGLPIMQWLGWGENHETCKCPWLMAIMFLRDGKCTCDCYIVGHNVEWVRTAPILQEMKFNWQPLRFYSTVNHVWDDQP